MNTNNLIRAISSDGGVIFCAVDSTDIVSAAYQFHNTSAPCSAALGRLLTAASMMGSMLKNEDNSITLRVEGNGPAGRLIAVTDGRGDVRGYIENPSADMENRKDGKLNVGGVVGKSGTLSVVRDVGMKEPYIGMVPLVSGEIAEDITSYYATSEQIPTVCALGVLVQKDLSIKKAGGFLVQLLPGATEEEISTLENNLINLPSVTQMLESGKSLFDIMELVMNGFMPEILDECQTCYKCNCSVERTKKILISLGKNELEKLAEEERNVEVECQFCNKKYKIDVLELLK